MKDVIKMHYLTKVGIMLRYPLHICEVVRSTGHLYLMCKRWDLEDKLNHKDLILNIWIKILVTTIYTPLMLALVIPIVYFVSPYCGNLCFLIGIAWGLLMITIIMVIWGWIDTFRIIARHYYKHRKFKRDGYGKK